MFIVFYFILNGAIHFKYDIHSYLPIHFVNSIIYSVSIFKCLSVSYGGTVAVPHQWLPWGQGLWLQQTLELLHVA